MTGSMITFNENTVHQNIMKTLVTKRGTKSHLPTLSPLNPQVRDQKEAAAETQRDITRIKEDSISRENREKREKYLRIVNRADTMMTTRIDLSSDHMEWGRSMVSTVVTRVISSVHNHTRRITIISRNQRVTSRGIMSRGRWIVGSSIWGMSMVRERSIVVQGQELRSIHELRMRDCIKRVDSWSRDILLLRRWSQGCTKIKNNNR